MKKIFGYIYWFFCCGFKNWFAEHCIMHVPSKKPICPNNICEMCGKPKNILAAYDTGDGWEMFWECEDECDDIEEDDNLIGWWPFWFGAWANSDQLCKVGIRVV